MFKVRNRYTNEIVQVLNVRYEEMFDITYFLVWTNEGWSWENSFLFIPPNWEE